MECVRWPLEKCISADRARSISRPVLGARASSLRRRRRRRLGAPATVVPSLSLAHALVRAKPSSRRVARFAANSLGVRPLPPRTCSAPAEYVLCNSSGTPLRISVHPIGRWSAHSVPAADVRFLSRFISSISIAASRRMIPPPRRRGLARLLGSAERTAEGRLPRT